VNSVEYDATLDELADVQMRVVKSTATYRRQRRESQWAIGVIVCGVLAVLLEGQVPIALVVMSSVACGGAAAYLYGKLHERYILRHYRRMVRELYRGVSSIRCAVDLREKVVWTKTGGTEVSFPWSGRTAVKNNADSIEMWFDPGLVVVRNRAFRTEAERAAFLHTVRNFGSEKAV
jgi:hypothetical protein